eukprot:COSAG02_NODE_10466_length_1935_cov_1.978214_3_plen_24_part_01
MVRGVDRPLSLAEPNDTTSGALGC